ncbi:hypothetical protein LEP1GSC170_5615 [Leptospira interrogans serovar Bataviae str. HAI135]|nr:hypothetical protein LEP1GSC170_5615 [Leptospira interrogans serovar Bataviae str. HAI135]
MNFLIKQIFPPKKSRISHVLLGLILTFYCSFVLERETFLAETNLKAPKIWVGKVFLAGHTVDHKKDTSEILRLIQTLVEDTVAKDYSKLPDQVSPKEGLLLDLKGIWTREEIKKELSKKKIISRLIFSIGNYCKNKRTPKT